MPVVMPHMVHGSPRHFYGGFGGFGPRITEKHLIQP
jgi:hypothetical protein